MAAQKGTYVPPHKRSQDNGVNEAPSSGSTTITNNERSFDDNQQRSYSNRERDSRDFRSGGGSNGGNGGNGGGYSSNSNYKSSRSHNNNSYDRDAEPPYNSNHDNDVGESDMARLNLRGNSLQSGSNTTNRFDSTSYNNNSYSSSTHSSSGFGSKNRSSDRDRDRDSRDSRDNRDRGRDRDWDRERDRDSRDNRDWDRDRDRDRPSSNGNFNYNSSTNSNRFNFMDRRSAGMTEEEMERELFDTENEMTQGINFDVYDKIPVELSGTDPPEGLATFQDSKLHDQLLYNVLRCKYTKPTPVQKYAIPCIMTGKDLMACAQTGSGKTAAFLLPIIHRMLETPPLNKSHERSFGYSYRSKAYPRAVILSPTRELAIQIEEQARKFLWKTRMRSVVIYGGANASNQLRELSRGCEIIVATPGRLLDFIESGKVGVDYVQFCVLDEGDRMLDMGFMPQIQDIIREMPRKGTRQTLMFSATFPPEIQKLAQEFLSDYLFLAVGRVGSTNTFIRQKMMYVEDREKLKQLMDLLPSCEGLTLIFVETRRDANDVENQLIRQGFDAISIHGDRSQREREHALAMFRNGKCPILVATDVAARGLDIPNVLWVVNYDLPNNVEAYVHRIGRTGRCGHDGNAIAFVNDKNKPVLQDLLHLLRETKQDVPQWFSEMVYKNRRDAWDKRAARNHYRPDYNTRDYRRSQTNRDSNFTSRRYNEGRYFGKDKENRDEGWNDNKDRNWNSYDRSDGENKMRSFNNGSDLKSRPIGDTAGESVNDSYKWNFDGKNDSW